MGRLFRHDAIVDIHSYLERLHECPDGRKFTTNINLTAIPKVKTVVMNNNEEKHWKIKFYSLDNVFTCGECFFNENGLML